jgi:hypothetical protein
MLKDFVIWIFAGLLSAALFAPQMRLAAQSTMLAELNFDPAKNGFSFKNYNNKYNTWKDDIDKADLIRMFGIKAVCKSGTSLKNCVEHASTRRWAEERLEQLEIGHCEGMSVASFRFGLGLPFKGKRSPSQFQAGASQTFDIKFDQAIQNYISYYSITQVLPEVREKTEATAAEGPIAIVQTLIEGMKNRTDTFLLGMRKYDPASGRISDGHAVSPFKVEDTGSRYKIHVYDNNFPGKTRYVFVDKNAAEGWQFASKADGKSDYIGNKRTQTLDLTATSWRDGLCFSSSFEKDLAATVGCGDGLIAARPSENVFFRNASYVQRPMQTGDEHAEFFLTGDGEMLVVDADNRRLGYDPRVNQYFREIPDSSTTLINGGLGYNVPSFAIPYEEEDDEYEIVFSGKYLDQESDFDFVFSAPGFTVGLDDIRLDPGETLTAKISYDGEEISFTSSADGETPDVFFAFDDEDDSQASYLTEIGGVELSRGTTLAFNFDFEHGKLFMTDSDGNEDAYDIELIRINADGTEQVYVQDDLNIGDANRYEMDFGDWDGKGPMCFKDDEDGDGFDDEKCDPQRSDRR